MKHTIFLDIDGVLADTAYYTLHQKGLYIDHPFDMRPYDVLVEYGIETGAINEQDYWEQLPHDFWASIPLTLEARVLLLWSMNSVGKENVFLATSPTHNPTCYSGKAAWIKNNMPEWLVSNRQYFIGHHKDLLAGPGRLLIDDRIRNVEGFEKHGGVGFLVHRPWNNNPTMDIATLLDKLDESAERCFK